VAHVLAGIALLSMVVGSLLALSERRIGRMLAFSGTAQLGTLLAGFLGGTEGTYAASTYLAAYVLTSACAFGGLAWAGLDQKVETMDDLKGLAWRSPWAALTFCAGLWSLAGMPLSFGFIGKVVVLSADAQAYQWLLVGTVVVSTALGAGFYLRAFVPVFQKVEGDKPASDVTAGVPLLLGLVVILLVGGLWPGPALSWIQAEVVDSMAVVP
jgi:NADH-quinone oxidoreductase subunit N